MSDWYDDLDQDGARSRGYRGSRYRDNARRGAEYYDRSPVPGPDDDYDRDDSGDDPQYHYRWARSPYGARYPAYEDVPGYTGFGGIFYEGRPERYDEEGARTEFDRRDFRYRGRGSGEPGYPRRPRPEFGYRPRAEDDYRVQPGFRRDRGYAGDEDFSEAGYDYDLEVEAGDLPGYWSYSEYWLIPGPYTGMGPRGFERSDERIYEDICERLTQHGQLDASDIEVRVQDGLVTLSGQVDGRQAKHLAEDTVDTVVGVREVRNELRLRRGMQDRRSGEAGNPRRSEEFFQPRSEPGPTSGSEE